MVTREPGRAAATFAAVAILALAVGCEEPPGIWHFEGMSHRMLVQVWVRAGAESARPVLVRVNLGRKVSPPLQVRAWDLDAEVERAAQFSDGLLAIDPGGTLHGGATRNFLVYFAEGAPLTAGSPVQVDRDYGVTAQRYAARVALDEGGVLKSLRLQRKGRQIELLAEDGASWWVNRNPRISQTRLMTVKARVTARGPVFAAVECRYPGVLAERNRMITTYRFFETCIDVEHRYERREPARIDWFKAPVTVRATGTAAGVHGCSAQQGRPCLTEGAEDRRVHDPRWHDVSYGGAQGFGLGVVAQEVEDGLWFTDSVKAQEHESIYAELFGGRQTLDVAGDFAVRMTLVPHGGGPDGWRQTLQHLPDAVTAEAGGLQARGERPIDTDGDGLSDLTEAQQGTSITSSDTDFDGRSDADDGEPLHARRAEPEPPRSFTPSPTRVEESRAAIQRMGGVPTLTVNGEAVGPMTFTPCAMTDSQMAEMAGRGFQVYCLMVGRVGWPDRQMAALRRLDERVEGFLDAVPNAYLILRCYLSAPPEFGSKYREECMAFNDGSREHFSEWQAMEDRPSSERGYPSFASRQWREGMARALYEYVTHVRKATYGGRVVGYVLGAGADEEWRYWSDYDRAHYALDFGPPMLRAFRRGLQTRYDGSVAALRRAWGDPCADFATARPPGPAERGQTDCGYFWDPAVSRRLMDYYDVHNRVVAESLSRLARAVKEASGEKALVGAFFGYVQGLDHVEGGHAAMRALLDCEDLDFWAGPPQADRRGPGEHGCIRSLNATLKAHDTLWMSESDIRTSLAKADHDNPARGGRPPDIETSLACLKREFGHLLCEGANGWWFPQASNWYTHETVGELFERMQLVGRAALEFDRGSAAEIAAVVDLESLLATPSEPISAALLGAFRTQELCRIGAPCDFWELSDLLEPGARRYKVYVFLNAFSLTAAERHRIRARLARDGAVLVWMLAPGLIQPDAEPALSLAHSRELTGIALEEQRGAGLSYRMKLTAQGAAFAEGFDAGRVFGDFERPRWGRGGAAGTIAQHEAKPRRWRQRFTAREASDVTALARFAEGGGIAMALRRGAEATDLWIGSVTAPADLLRAVARRAGCHLYYDGDAVLYANRSFLCLHTHTGGGRILELRRPADVVEVFSGARLAREAGEFADDIPPYSTRLYFLGDAAAWQAAMDKSRTWLQAHRADLERLRNER